MSNPTAPNEDAFKTDICEPILGPTSHPNKLAIGHLSVESQHGHDGRRAAPSCSAATVCTPHSAHQREGNQTKNIGGPLDWSRLLWAVQSGQPIGAHSHFNERRQSGQVPQMGRERERVSRWVEDEGTQTSKKKTRPFTAVIASATWPATGSTNSPARW